MAHFAELNQDNIVVRVLVVPDSEENRGEEYLASDIGLGGRWIQTSITNRIRGVFATVGMEYLPEVDKFMPLKPESNPSFIFDDSQWKWVQPVTEPEDADWVMDGNRQPEFQDVEIEIDGEITVLKQPILPENPKVYIWNEELVAWDLLPLPRQLTPEEIEAMQIEAIPE